MSNDKGSLPDWAGAMFAGVLTIGSAAGVYTTLSTDIAVNKAEIENINRELVIYSEHAKETRELIRDLLIKEATAGAERASLKKLKRLL